MATIADDRHPNADNKQLSSVAADRRLRSTRAATVADSPLRSRREKPSAAVAESVGRDWPLVARRCAGHRRCPIERCRRISRSFGNSTFRRGRSPTTPIVFNGMVFIGDLDGVVRAIDLADGKRAVEVQTGEPTTASRPRPVTEMDSSTSAIWEACFIASMPPPAKSDGAARPTAQSIPAPISTTAHVIFGSEDNNLYCLDLKTGKQVWKLTLTDQIQCSPTVVDNRAFLAGCDGSFPRRRSQQRNEDAAGRSISKGRAAKSPAVVGDVVYFGTEGGTFFAIDWKKGTIALAMGKHGARRIDRQRRRPA